MDAGFIQHTRTVLAGGVLLGGLSVPVLMTTATAEAQDRLSPQRSATVSSQRGERHAPDQLDLRDEDRLPLEVMRNFAPPEFTEDLVWHDWVHEGCKSWHTLRDRVIILQSWNHGHSDTIEQVRALHELVTERYFYTDVQIIALHTPEDADALPDELPFDLGHYGYTVVDPTGEFSDALGIYREPVNIVVDRNGRVSQVALTTRGIQQALARLIDQSYDSERVPDPFDPSRVATNVRFPHFVGTTGRSTDVRGQPAPEITATDWVNGEPTLDGQVVLLEFWRTSCPHCINAIPHLNDIARTFADDLVVVGLSSESPQAFEQGMSRHNLSLARFQYYVALDARRRTMNNIGVSGVPHAIVICSRGTVRWQGHPASLQTDTVRQIIDADRAVRMAGSRERWTKG